MPYQEITCSECKGDGKVKCENCNGKGTWKETSGGITASYYCNVCDGTGRITCSPCTGYGKVTIWVDD